MVPTDQELSASNVFDQDKMMMAEMAKIGGREYGVDDEYCVFGLFGGSRDKLAII